MIEWMSMSLLVVWSSKDNIRALGAKLSTSGQRCSQEILTRFESTILLLVGGALPPDKMQDH